MTKPKAKVNGRKPKRKNAAKVKPARSKGAKAIVKHTRDKAGKRWFTDVERIGVLAALRANDNDIGKTAREQGVPYKTLWAWSVGRRCPEALQLATDYEQKIDVAIWEIAWQACALIPATMDKAPLNHLMGALDKAIQNGRLLRGESTSNTESRTAAVKIDYARLTDDERREFIRLYKRAGGTEGTDGGTGSEESRSAGPPGTGGPVPRPVPAVLG